ncbi:MAG: ATP-binding protein, partial [Chthoniobacterales bacterium]
MAFEKELQAHQGNLSKRLSDAHYREVNPFRGLEFFDSEHAPFFYGRTKAVAEVLNLLQQQATDKKPFVLVLGPRASGKTSLVRAGILPVLTQAGITEGDRSWRLAFSGPAEGGAVDPLDALAMALLKESALPEFPDAATRNGWQNLAAELREAPEDAALRLRETLQHLGVQALDHFLDEQGLEVSPARLEESVELPGQNRLGRVEPKVQLALVVDQLEELFVGGFSSELQQKYIAALGALVRWRIAFVIATLRSDFYEPFQKCCRPQDLALLTRPEFRVRNIDLSQVLSGRFDLQAPSPCEIGDMIRLPAEATGLRFELDPGTGQNLDAALLEAATAQAEPLPLLEHLLYHLYRKQLPRKDGLLRWSDYRELGEFEGALANHAESVFLGLDGDAQAALKSVIQQLVSPGPSEDLVLMCRTVAYRDLTSTPKFSEHRKAGTERLIDRFIKEGLFHTETGPNAEVVVSVTQECLLRNWPRVRQLLNADLGLLRTRDRLEPNFKLWLSRGCRGRDLLSTWSGIREAKALLRGFRASLSESQVDYLQRSLKAQNRRRRVRIAVVLAVFAGLIAPVTI